MERTQQDMQEITARFQTNCHDDYDSEHTNDHTNETKARICSGINSKIGNEDDALLEYSDVFF